MPPRTYLLHARLLLRLGETERAGHQYRRALEFDPSLADEDLASRLGITRSSPTAPPAGQPSGDDPFVEQGRMREAWAETLGGEGQTTTEVERPKLNFADVGGHGGAQGRDPAEDHPPAHAPRAVQGLRQGRSAAAS